MRNIDEYRDRNKENMLSDIKPNEVIEERPRDVPIQQVRSAKDPGQEDKNLLLMDAGKGKDFQERWNAIQTAFVDNPAKAVQEADRLIEEAIKHIADTFAADRDRRARERGADNPGSTEDLRLALQRYRVILGRLMGT